MMRSTAKADHYHNWRARGARQGCDAITNRKLDEYQSYDARKHGWEYWFQFGDEIV